MNEQNFIDFQNVTYSYDEYDDDGRLSDDVNVAVDNMTFSINEGEFVALIGRNGSGKSTIARHINGLLVPQSGVVYVDGINTKDEELIWNIRCNVGMVFQNPDNQIIGTTVEEDIAFGLENIGIPRDEMIIRMNDAIATTKLVECRFSEPHLLSGGQKQRVAIAGILAMRPKCIVLDEATAMLDPVGRREVMSVIKELNKNAGITIVHITHHMDEVTVADRVFLIDEGKILLIGTPKEVFSKEEMVIKAGLEVPQATQLFNLLRKKGFILPEDVITAEEAFDYLKLILKR